MLLAAAAGTVPHACIVVSLLTGARTGELRALTWSHDRLDADPPFIEVWHPVRAKGETKTRQSRRSLELPQLCVDVLRLHHELQDKIRSDMSATRQDSDLVFCTHSGTPLDAASVRGDQAMDGLFIKPGGAGA